VYEIFVRSFADSNGDGIGDLTGIREKLDYLQTLQVDVIWLMPIYPSPSVHGYDVTDFFDVNPDYGTRQDLIQLVEAVHKRDMRIILDFVPSHLSDDHPYFQEAYNNPEAPRSDWFVWTNNTHTAYAGFADSKDMPRFNHYNPEVVDYLVHAALFWLDLDQDGDYSDGVDGFRVDNVTFPPEEFFGEFRQQIKAVNPDVLLLGEAWLHSPSDLSRFFEGKFDALFDFPFYELMQGNPGYSGDGVLAGRSFPNLISPLLDEQGELFPVEAYAVRFLNNHDTNRILSELEGDQMRARLVPALLATMPGPVMLYYGEEIGMLGKKGTAPHWDSYRREPMQWRADNQSFEQTTWFVVEDSWNQPDDGISVEEQQDRSDSLLTFYQLAMGLRSSQPALQGQHMETLVMEVSARGPWGFLRGVGDQALIALFNFSTEPRTVKLSELPFHESTLIDVFTGGLKTYLPDEGVYSIEMGPGETILLGKLPPE
jgi:glycosidase